MALDWFCIYIAMFAIGIEGIVIFHWSTHWQQWVRWTSGIGEGVFVLLAIIVAIRWRRSLSVEQRKVRKLSLTVIMLGTVGNVLFILLALGLLPIG